MIGVYILYLYIHVGLLSLYLAIFKAKIASPLMFDKTLLNHVLRQFNNNHTKTDSIIIGPLLILH